VAATVDAHHAGALDGALQRRPSPAIQKGLVLAALFVTLGALSAR
jgi:hypothetical protein